MYFNQNNQAVKRLILINLAVFGFQVLMWVFAFLMNMEFDPQRPIVTNPLLQYFFLPSEVGLIFVRPWTVVTHMFMHAGFGHLFFNMITLYFIGRITSDFFANKKIYQLYFFGGLFGAFVTVLSFSIFPVFQGLGVVPMMGASAAVLAIIMATVALLPHYEVYLFGLFKMKLMWLGLIIVALDVINIPRGNSGGHIAHLGGALFGYLYVVGMQKGFGLDKLTNRLRRVFVRKPRVVFDERKYYRRSKSPKERVYQHQSQESNKSQGNRARPDQEEIDAILDKINQSGYTSLTAEEKEILFRASK